MKKILITFFAILSLFFYSSVFASEYGTYHGIIRILRTEINRNYNGMSKQFSGSLYVNLEQADRIFYIINGDFFDNGTTTLSGGLNIGIGEGASANLGGSYVDNHYKYVYHEGRVHF